MTDAPTRPARRFWRTARICFRRFRILGWLCILVALGSLIYLNQVGLPGFIKRPLLQKLRARGLDLQFSRLRLRWYQGIVAENVRFGQAREPASGQLTVDQLRVLLNLKALLHGQLQVDRLVLSRGRLLLNLPATKATPRQLTVDNIQTDLRLLPQDQWALDNFRADFAGASIELSGMVTNASAVADWEFLHGRSTGHSPTRAWQRRLARLADELERIHFSAPPELRIEVRGDARELQSFTVRLRLQATGAETPWGTLSDGRFTGRLLPADTNGETRADISLQASSARTSWAAVTNLHLNMVLFSAEPRTNLIRGELKVSAAGAQTKWASATNARFSASWLHSITNLVPLSGTGRFRCDTAETRWASAQHVELSGSLLKPAPEELPVCDKSWAWWTNLQPYALAWECRVSEARTPEFTSKQLSLAGTWRAPTLSLTNFYLQTEEGGASAKAELDVLSRRLRASLQSSLDPHALRAFLPEASRRWLDALSWAAAPGLNAQAEVVLPAWTNSQPDWRGQVQPSLRLSGEISLARVAYHQVQVTSLHSHFTYSNRCWLLPDLSLATPEGRLEGEHKTSDATKDFYWHLRSSVDLRRFRPLLAPQAQKAFDLVEFTGPPAIDCQVWGRWRAPQQIGVRAHVAVTNFAFRGQAADWLETSLEYTNRLLRFYQTRVAREDQRASVEGLTADFDRQLVFLTNGVSTFDPMAIANAIGPKIGHTIAPYHFHLPPQARVEGTVPMHGEEGADLHFRLEGGPFSWWRFHVPHVVGEVHWAGEHLLLKDMRLNFYGGAASGAAQFDFLPPPRGADFTLAFNTTNTVLQGLMADLFAATNHLEGWLNAAVSVTKANTESWTNLFAFGALDLRDGLIWDIPLFGIFSPILNGISPGLGNFRASSGTCSFVITNGVIRSGDLQIRSPAVRLQYRGTLDFDGNVNARVEAELLRDVWLVGPIVSTVLWPVTKMFEYRVTGSLAEPRLDPVYIVPKLVLTPFHPFRTLKSLLQQDPAAHTNASPPVFQDLSPQGK